MHARLELIPEMKELRDEIVRDTFCIWTNRATFKKWVSSELFMVKLSQ